MIKIGYTNHKGNPILPEIERLKKNARILEDNGETGTKKAFWKKKNLKT